MSTPVRVSRRDLLKATGLGGLALALGIGVPGASCARQVRELDPNVFVRVGPDGAVRLTVHRTEMGQGVKTALGMVLADELDADWDRLEVVQAEGHQKYGNQSTGGSRSIRNHFTPLRKAGAAARTMLVVAAAERWGVDAATCDTKPGRVVHPPSGREAGYGDLVAAAARLPVPADPPLKDPSEFRYIGTSRTGVDMADMVRGAATYGGDLRLPDMAFAVLARSPTVDGSLASLDAEAARQVPGVIDVIELPPLHELTNAAVAVVAEHTWAALRGREALQIEWAKGELTESTPAHRETLAEVAGQPGRAVREQGDVDAALAEAEHVIEARYTGPYYAHAPMEPNVCTAVVGEGSATIHASTQAPQWARREVAELLDLPEDAVTVKVMLLGGAFGRKSKPDVVLEAAALAREVGRPVQVVWTRDDDLQHGFYRAENHQYLKGGVDADGRPVAWLHRTVFPGIGWSFEPEDQAPSEGELSQGFSNLPYRIPHLRLEAGSVRSALRIGWFRSVCNTFHAFAVNGFLDELAHAAGRDPIEVHLEALGEPRIVADEGQWPFATGRLQAVIERVRDESGWGGDLPEGEGRGFAAHYSFHSYNAMVARVAMVDGEMVVREVHTALDCGRVVNPDTVRAQMQGAVAMGLSLAKHGEITVEGGVVQERSFSDFPVLRIDEMPEVHVHLVDSDAPPTGVGEPGVPPVAPAVVNALFAASGTRIRDLPIDLA